MAGTINGGDTPRDADPQEDVYRVTSGHIAHARVGIFVLASGHLARKRVWNKFMRSWVFVILTAAGVYRASIYFNVYLTPNSSGSEL